MMKCLLECVLSWVLQLSSKTFRKQVREGFCDTLFRKKTSQKSSVVFNTETGSLRRSGCYFKGENHHSKGFIIISCDKIFAPSFLVQPVPQR